MKHTCDVIKSKGHAFSYISLCNIYNSKASRVAVDMLNSCKSRGFFNFKFCETFVAIFCCVANCTRNLICNLSRNAIKLQVVESKLSRVTVLFLFFLVYFIFIEKRTLKLYFINIILADASR